MSKSGPKGIDWSRVDWADGVKDIARAAELGVCERTVAEHRRAAGAPRDKRRGIDWDAVDLSRPTMQIARELGVAKSGVWAARKRRGVTEYARDPRARKAHCA